MIDDLFGIYPRLFHPMNKFFLYIFVPVITSLFLSCAPKPKVTPTPTQIAIPVPYNLKASAFNGKATLLWKVNRPTNFVSGGYNIYLREARADSAILYNQIPYPGDTDGDPNKETFEITDLKNGQAYFTWVRMLAANGALGAASETLQFIPFESGQLTIYFDMLRDSSGYSFVKHKYTKARDFNNDFYLYDKNGPHISSPSVYNSGLRKSTFQIYKPKPYAQFRKDSKPTATSIELLKANSYQMITADRDIIFFKIDKYSSSENDKRAIIRYTYIRHSEPSINYPGNMMFPPSGPGVDSDADSHSGNISD